MPVTAAEAGPAGLQATAAGHDPRLTGGTAAGDSYTGPAVVVEDDRDCSSPLPQRGGTCSAKAAAPRMSGSHI